MTRAPQIDFLHLLVTADLVRWWPSVYLDVRETAPADARGLGRRVSLLTKGWLPYTLRWSFTISTTLPAVSASLMAQGDGNDISCKITVDGVVREHQNADGHNAQTFCLVKSA